MVCDGGGVEVARKEGIALLCLKKNVTNLLPNGEVACYMGTLVSSFLHPN